MSTIKDNLWLLSLQPIGTMLVPGGHSACLIKKSQDSWQEYGHTVLCTDMDVARWVTVKESYGYRDWSLL